MDNDKNQITGYPNIGLDKHMMPQDGPITSGGSFVSVIDWDIYHPRDTVSSIHVKNISFSTLIGGTATLGGVANGNGLLTVNNAGGTQVVRLDNTGIVITAGTISGVQFTGTTTQFTGTFDSITMTGQNIFNGTVTNNKLITGGTISNTSLNNPTIGTPTLSNGTLNPDQYQTGGTAEAAGSFVYIKTVNFAGSTTTLGTVRFKGIIYSNA